MEAGVLLLLARVCSFMESNALVHVMETLAATFPGQGGGSGIGQPPAFVAGEVARLALLLLPLHCNTEPMQLARYAAFPETVL